MFDMGTVWLLIIIAGIIIEGMTMGLFTIWFAIGALVAAIVFMLNGNIVIQISAFLITSIILLIFTRPLATKYLKIGKTKTNIDSLIGVEAKVIEDIDNINNTGAVKVKGQVWSARTEDNSLKICEGSIVSIKRIEGVKLIVSNK